MKSLSLKNYLGFVIHEECRPAATALYCIRERHSVHVFHHTNFHLVLGPNEKRRLGALPFAFSFAEAPLAAFGGLETRREGLRK